MCIQMPFIINSYWSTTINSLLPVVNNVIQIINVILIKFIFYIPPVLPYIIYESNGTDSIVKYN